MNIKNQSNIVGSVCSPYPGFKGAGSLVQASRLLNASAGLPDVPKATIPDEGQRLLELTKELHQRVYTTEQRLHLLSNLLQAQSLKLHLLAR